MRYPKLYPGCAAVWTVDNSGNRLYDGYYKIGQPLYLVAGVRYHIRLRPSSRSDWPSVWGVYQTGVMTQEECSRLRQFGIQALLVESSPMGRNV